MSKTAKKPAAKKSTAKKSAPTAKMSAAKKSAPAKSASAKKPAAKVASAKSASAKKPAAKKPAAKAAPARSALAKKPAPKAAPAKSAPAKKPAAKSRAKRPEITVGITPPDLAPDTDAAQLDQALARPDTRPSPDELAKLPWLAQDEAYLCGYYLLTHGLQAHDHPELELCNVPGALVGASAALLRELAEYVEAGHGRFSHGQTMAASDTPLAVVGFLRVGANERGTVHDAEVLRVVFLR